VKQRRVIVVKLAAKYHAALVDFQKVFDDGNRRAPADYWIWDAIHPTYSGHQLLADEWERVVLGEESVPAQQRGSDR
jgi:lysophospholipase L1-like esterase